MHLRCVGRPIVVAWVPNMTLTLRDACMPCTSSIFEYGIMDVCSWKGPPGFKISMNSPGNDDRQLALNLLHWLSGPLE